MEDQISVSVSVSVSKKKRFLDVGAIRRIALPKSQITNYKLQINTNFQIPMTQTKKVLVLVLVLAGKKHFRM